MLLQIERLTNNLYSGLFEHISIHEVEDIHQIATLNQVSLFSPYIT